MPIYQSNNSSGSTLNTSNITVPSVATMVQHLLDEDPHPQYLLAEQLSSSISANVSIGDLADVKFGISVVKDHVIVHNGACWTNMPASALISSMGLPSAVSSSLVEISSAVTSNTNTLVSNVNNISSIFHGTVEVIEEQVTLEQTDPTVACSAIISGHILTAYDSTGSRINTLSATYSGGVSTLYKDFGSAHSEQWTIVHSVPISTVITSNIISKVIPS